MVLSNLCWQTGQDFADQDFKSDVSRNLKDFQAKHFAKSMPWIVIDIDIDIFLFGVVYNI